MMTSRSTFRDLLHEVFEKFQFIQCCVHIILVAKDVLQVASSVPRERLRRAHRPAQATKPYSDSRQPRSGSKKKPKTGHSNRSTPDPVQTSRFQFGTRF